MKLKINANRMNLLKLRKRLKFALRGHKLLKDKQEQLTKEFNKLIHQVKLLRKEIETGLEEVYTELAVTYSNYSLELVQRWCEIVPYIHKVDFEFKEEYKFNLKYTMIKYKHIKDKNYSGLITAEPYFNSGIKKLITLLPKIVELTNTERLIELIAKELQTTRRRVNALEYILIPQIKYWIKFIINKLNELERTNIIQLMRIKQVLR